MCWEVWFVYITVDEVSGYKHVSNTKAGDLQPHMPTELGKAGLQQLPVEKLENWMNIRKINKITRSTAYSIMFGTTCTSHNGIYSTSQICHK